MRELLVLQVALWACACLAAGAPKRGDVVYQSHFQDQASRDAWSPADFARWVPEGPGGAQCLRVTVAAADVAGSHVIRLPLDVTPYRGCRLQFECMAKAEGVTQPPQPYLGTKFMFHYQSPAEGPFFDNQNDVYGTFDWKKLSFFTTIAPDAIGGDLFLGMQDSSGTAWFDALKVTVAWPPPPVRPAPDPNAPPAFKGHGLPRLRGVMSPNQFRDEDLRVLGQEWHANLIRWQMTRYWGSPNTDRDLAEYDRWIDGKLAEAQQATEACKRYGIKLVLDLHSPPGGRYQDNRMAMLFEPVYQDHFVAVWEKIARRFKGNPAVWGYDLVNEPVQGRPSPEGVGDYLEAQVRAAKAIRAIDPDTPIIVEADQWDSPEGYRFMSPVDVPRVIYQVHMYWPTLFTHQGVYGGPTGVRYPGPIGGVQVNKEALRKYLQPVRDFQLAYNVHIYVGEFSAARWAPGAAQYLGDLIDLYEEYGWDWSYHAYREWDGWSLEHGPDKDDHQPTKEPTDRMKVVVGWFAKNVRP